MEILFLDIDGVVNCATTAQRHRGFIGIDPYMSLLVNRIIEETGAKVVLSSTWRHDEESRKEVKEQVCDFIDITPNLQRRVGDLRGEEIKAWLDSHPEVEKYAILDDDSDFLPEQLPNFFKTDWNKGLTEEISRKVIKHLGSRPERCLNCGRDMVMQIDPITKKLSEYLWRCEKCTPKDVVLSIG